MIKALYTSATGLAAQQLVVDNTSNNLANANTTGFKRSQMDFQDLLYVTSRQPGAEAAQNLTVPSGLQIGSGVRPAGNTKLFTEGVLVNTGNALDVAIQGDGFLQVTLPNNEIRYTRAGTLQQNANGQLVTVDGFLVTPQVTFPQGTQSISIGTDGTVSVTLAGGNGGSQTQTLTQLQLVRFANPAGLSSEGSNLFAQTASSGQPVIAVPGQNGLGTLLQGFRENSNVDVVQEMVNLILAQRAYEFNTKAIQSADQMLSDTNNLVR